MIIIDSLRCTLVNEAGFPDELAEVKLTDEALLLEGHLLPEAIGSPWAELAHVLQHPLVQEKLQESELLAGASIV